MTTYTEHLESVEAHLSLIDQAARGTRATLITGESACDGYGRAFATPDGEARLRGRTPFSLDRDRILYSDAFRRQDDKFHVLFFGKTRRARNYTGHAVKAAHLSRVIASRLQLNADLAEAISIGAKVGATPFLHVSKDTIRDWMKTEIELLNQSQMAREMPARAHAGRGRRKPPPGPALDMTPTPAARPPVPSWIGNIPSASIREQVQSAFPWAYGDGEAYYGSGSHSYWNLTFNPFTLGLRSSSTTDTAFTAQVMYGIWRHSLPIEWLEEGPDSAVVLGKFLHEATSAEGYAVRIDDSHATYEAMVARYCDDIAWALENLVEAARVDSADAATTAYERFAKHIISEGADLPPQVANALITDDAGKLYSYFIDDMVRVSAAQLQLAPVQATEESMKFGVCLSQAGSGILFKLITFLNDDIFENSAIRYRNTAAAAITKTALNILQTMETNALSSRIERIARVEGWYSTSTMETVQEGLRAPVFRIQACVALLVSMADRELFELVGLES